MVDSRTLYYKYLQCHLFEFNKRFRSASNEKITVIFVVLSFWSLSFSYNNIKNRDHEFYILLNLEINTDYTSAISKFIQTKHIFFSVIHESQRIGSTCIFLIDAWLAATHLLTRLCVFIVEEQYTIFRYRYLLTQVKDR